MSHEFRPDRFQIRKDQWPKIGSFPQCKDFQSHDACPTLSLNIKFYVAEPARVMEQRTAYRPIERSGLLTSGMVGTAQGRLCPPSYCVFLASGECGRPRSGAAESWPISTMPRRMARVRVKCSNNASPSLRRMARVSFERSSLKVPSISSTASLLLRNTSRHIVGSDAAMRVKSRKPPAENFITSDDVTCASSSAVPTMV